MKIPGQFSAQINTYQALELHNRRIVEFKRDTHLFLWEGAEFCAVMKIALLTAGLSVECPIDGVITILDTDGATVRQILRQLTASPPGIQTLAEFVENLQSARYDNYVPEEVLISLWASRHARHANRIAAVSRELSFD